MWFLHRFLCISFIVCVATLQVSPSSLPDLFYTPLSCSSLSACLLHGIQIYALTSLKWVPIGRKMLKIGSHSFGEEKRKVKEKEYRFNDLSAPLAGPIMGNTTQINSQLYARAPMRSVASCSELKEQQVVCAPALLQRRDSLSITFWAVFTETKRFRNSHNHRHFSGAKRTQFK